MPLSNADEQAVRALNREHVEIAISNLKPNLANSTWLKPDNRYSENIVKRLRNDFPLRINRRRDLCDYIAACGPLHANDGWSYLGRAVSALLHGDPHRALHLAYYAELRGALSLLASDGIGIFNGSHYVIVGGNDVRRFDLGSGTHLAAWEMLKFWSRQPASGALFSRLVRPDSNNLDDWLHAVGGSGALGAQAHDWFTHWGMDLAESAKDQDARNESSYRPDGVPTSWAIRSDRVIEFSKELWAVLRPSELSVFREIDRHILRKSIEAAYKGRTSREPVVGNLDYVRHIDLIVRSQGMADRAKLMWADFLLRKIEPLDPRVFLESARRPANASDDALGIISRAVLLLRFATGSARDLLERAGIHDEDIAFWSNGSGMSRGLWDPSLPAPDFADLWADIEVTLEDAKEFEEPLSVYGLIQDWGAKISTLTSYERVGLWSLCAS